jgi:hypothetical protein
MQQKAVQSTSDQRRLLASTVEEQVPMTTTPFVTAMQSLAWPARLDNTPITLSWNAPATEPMRFVVAMSHTPSPGASAVEIAKLSQADLSQVLTAIADQLNSLEIGMIQSGTRIDTVAGDTLMIMGRLAPALRLTIRIDRAGQRTQILALDPTEIHQAIKTIGVARQACAS